MSPDTVTVGTDVALAPAMPTTLPVPSKAIDLAMLRRGARDYLDFLDATKELFFGYLYHSTGSAAQANVLLREIYLAVLSRAMSLWWFGTLSFTLLLDQADRVLATRSAEAADLDRTYLPTLTWLSDDERRSVGSVHDVIWTLPRGGRRIVILSLLLGLPDKRIAELLRMTPEAAHEQITTAQSMLIERWQPCPSLMPKLQSLTFVPGIDLPSETALRFSVVEKYNALRMRRYQWVVLAGLFAVLSNVIVAGVIAFLVVVQPPTSLKSQRREVASFSAVLLERQLVTQQVRESVARSALEARKVAAYDASRRLTTVGLGAARSALEEQLKQEADVQAVIHILRRAATALVPVLRFIAAVMGWM